jgi:hypothetical protein
MAACTLETISKLLYSIPGKAATGVAIGAAVWKASEKLENYLSDDAKLKIAIWLLGLHVPIGTIQTWPETFANVFDRLFGSRHLSWKCFWRSALISYIAVFLTGSYLDGLCSTVRPTILYDMLRFSFVGNVLPDYISLLETRYVLGLIQRTVSPIFRIAFLLLDLVLTSGIALLTAHSILSVWWVNGDPRRWDWSPSGIVVNHALDFHQNHSWIVFVFPAFLTSIWLWLYVGSGFLLRAARRLDIGFGWFNRNFDIEHKPLQSIGFVSGLLAMLGCWLTLGILRAFKIAP